MDFNPDFDRTAEDAQKLAESLLASDEVRRGRELTPQEEQEYRDGLALSEMIESTGFKVLKRWLEDMAFHSWADPRETKDDNEWKWRELNAFHAANNAKELIERIELAVSRSDYLGKVRTGEIAATRGFKI